MEKAYGTFVLSSPESVKLEDFASEREISRAHIEICNREMTKLWRKRINFTDLGSRLCCRMLAILGIAALFCMMGCLHGDAPMTDNDFKEEKAMKKLKILMIGNSFSLCVGKTLPRLANAAGCELLLGSAYIGGCSLETHWQHLQAADADAEFKPYQFNLWKTDPSGSGKITEECRPANVNEMLKMEEWDVVTVQQASALSWNYDTYQPFAQNIIARIRRDAPQARIVIQQTWAYCGSDGRLLGSTFVHPNNVHWNFDQKGMYSRLTDAYRRLAGENSFDIIPTGYAVELFRQNAPVHEPALTKDEVFSLVYPRTISQKDEPVGRVYWYLDENTRRQEIGFDMTHLNPVGEYLQGCVWFCFFFGENKAAFDYIPREMPAETANFCQQMAIRAVREF